MIFSGIADSEQLTMLEAALDDYCRCKGVEESSFERVELSRLVMALFNNGVSGLEALKAGLEATTARNERNKP